MFVYRCCAERRSSPDEGSYDCFGLMVQRLDCKHRPSPALALVPDISVDRTFVEHLAELYTAYQLDPVHLLDAVEDALL